jgi:hypothetical protein
MKKVTESNLIGQQGANLVEKIVTGMKFVWRPLLIFDVGIDGEIEICDPITRAATNRIIKVQIKTTLKNFVAENSTSFEYLCDANDLEYWLQGNVPVILVICRPNSDEAYWVSIKDYFSNLALRKNRKILFDKNKNRFTTNSASELTQLVPSTINGVYSFPIAKNEILYTNLLKLSFYPSQIFVADTEFSDQKKLWDYFKQIGAHIGSEWFVTEKKVISFYDLTEYPFNKVCDRGTCEGFDTNEWAVSTEIYKRNEFVRLLNQCLKEKTKLIDLRWDDKNSYFYFPATPNLNTRSVQYYSLKQRVTREVFKQYFKKNSPGIRSYCRHSAFKGYFVNMEDEWYLEITPTYHFTRNGFETDFFSKEHLSGIKRLERNPAVFGQLLMWAEYLKGPVTNLFAKEYRFLQFGDLATLDIMASLPDKAWYDTEEGIEAESLRAPENQLQLMGI